MFYSFTNILEKSLIGEFKKLKIMEKFFYKIKFLKPHNERGTQFQCHYNHTIYNYVFVKLQE